MSEKIPMRVWYKIRPDKTINWEASCLNCEALLNAAAVRIESLEDQKTSDALVNQTLTHVKTTALARAESLERRLEALERRLEMNLPGDYFKDCVFEWRTDPNGCESIYIRNPWNNHQWEHVATLFWPIHPPEKQTEVEKFYEVLKMAWSHPKL